MKLKNTLIGIGLGVGATLIIREAMKDKALSSPEHLQNMKEYFKTVKGKISGSWISTVKEEFFHDGQTQSVFRGGLTIEDGEVLKKFECLLDPYSGEILKAIKL